MKVRIFLGLASLLFLSACNTASEPPVSAEQLALARTGVAHNRDWTPVAQTVNGSEMMLVPSGCFMMGSTDEQLVEGQSSCDSYYGVYGCKEDLGIEQPAHEVCIRQPYWIDRTAVTNKAFGSSSNQGTDTSPYRGPNWPRETITWAQAAAFCEARGGRLPTEAEWEFAARGPDALIYPWGNEYDINRVTLHKLHPPEVGEHPEGASWVGALDMSGGIGEWVADWYGPYSSEAVRDPSGPENGVLKVARGGDWFAHAAYFVRTTFRDAFDPDFASTAVGVRCVAAVGEAQP
jgi:formylglycine-generating enzyme required for sulfatase activity